MDADLAFEDDFVFAMTEVPGVIGEYREVQDKMSFHDTLDDWAKAHAETINPTQPQPMVMFNDAMVHVARE